MQSLFDLSRQLDKAEEKITDYAKTCFTRSEVEAIVKEQYDEAELLKETYSTDTNNES